MPKPKTPVYTRKAIDKYRQKKDLITITTEKGTRERMRAQNITPTDVTQMLYDRLEELENK